MSDSYSTIIDEGRANLPMAVQRNQRRARKVAPKLLKYLSRIPFAEDLASAYFCALDQETPSRVKGVILAALGYFVLPTDLAPDFLIGLGFSDDAAVIAMTISIVGAHIRPHHHRAARRLLGLPDKPYENPSENH